MIPKKNPELEIGRNSSLYFAIGLNIMLFISWQALEHKSYQASEIDIGVVAMEAQTEEEIPLVMMNTPPPPPPPPAVISESMEVVEDLADVEETVFESTEMSQEEAIVEHAVSVSDVHVEEYVEEAEVPFAIIEEVPIFPGCEGLSKSAAIDCFQQKLQQHITTHFEYPLSALEMGIQGRVSVIFTIDSKGFTTNVRSRGPDRLLEKEAERIINLLPQMKAGKQRGKPVKVSYAVPIFFKYQEQ